MAVSYQYVDAELGFPAIAVTGDTTQRTNLGRIVVAQDATYGDRRVHVRQVHRHRGRRRLRHHRPAGQDLRPDPGRRSGREQVLVIGIAMAAQVNGQYGWVMVRGVHDAANVTAGLTVGTVLSGSATLGRCNQGVANYVFDGAVLRVAGIAGAGTVELYWPTCSGR
jgi:hypothetical protein